MIVGVGRKKSATGPPRNVSLVTDFPRILVQSDRTIWRAYPMPPSKPFWIPRWLTVLSLCLICSTLISAQTTGGRILGRVAHSEGTLLAGVKVTATNEATGVTHQTQTNSNGDYVFPAIPVGIYTLTFDMAGFKTNVRK